MSFPAPFLIRPTQKIISPIEAGTTTAYTVTITSNTAKTGVITVSQAPPSGLPAANKWYVIAVPLYYGSTAFPTSLSVKMGGVAAIPASSELGRQLGGTARYVAGFFLVDAALVPANATVDVTANILPAAGAGSVRVMVTPVWNMAQPGEFLTVWQVDRGTTSLGSATVAVAADEDPVHGRLGFNCCSTYENATTLSNTPFGWNSSVNIGTQYNLRCGYAKLASAATSIVWKVANNSYTCPTGPATIVIR
jgi:hypothetical protein